jgi:hypothetical protein
MLVVAIPSQAEMRPSLNFSGQVGIIDMPSGEQMPDGFLTFDHSRFGPILRNSLRFQIAPRLSGVFRYTGIHAWNAKIAACQDDDPSTPCVAPNDFATYYDRSFDISYQILTESQYLPSVTIGLQDFVGTGLSSAEYIAATKSFGPRLKVTAGIGFGRLGSFGSIGQPFGPRSKIDVGNGGNVNFKQWFRGDAAPFGGIEYQITDKLTFKAEYSSDAYTEEVDKRGTFERKSPMNFGLEYQPNPSVRIGGYYMYGSQIGLNMTFFLNPDQRQNGGIAGRGPEPVQVRASRASTPGGWATDWTEIEGIKGVLIDNLTSNLAGTGIVVESLGVTGSLAQVRFRNANYDAAAQAVGRVARAMTHSLPPSVEVFEIVPVDHGIAGSKVVIRRTDLEALEFAPDAGQALRVRSQIGEAGQTLPGTERNPALYPHFTWSLLPFARTAMFNPVNPLQVGVGLRFAAQYELAPGVILSGSVTQIAFGNIKTKPCTNCAMQHVRSDASVYDTNANPDLETLTAAWYTQLAPNLYGRVTVGYLERMFAGVSTEVLWRPVTKPWAVGAEVNYVAQRNTDGGLGFDEYGYRVATGHVSGYYDFGNGFHAQVDVGRYLAGDIGATIALTREFENGWRIGAFATKTNVSAKTFGEGSFDKGIMLQIPFSWLTGKPTRTSKTMIIRPIGRDGGARLEVNDRLYDVLRSYDLTRLDAQWGRVWK